MAATVSSSARNTELVVSTSDRTELPELRTSDSAFDKKKPLPTSLQSDFIPEDILLAITHPPPGIDKLGPATRYRNINTTDVRQRKNAANVWNYPGRRDKFKHLTKNTPCICGAGKDISFLYDIPKEQTKPDLSNQYDSSNVRVMDEEPKKPLTLPDTLIPDEYHVVKNKGVMGLEYYEEKFATQPADHESHLVQFPSMHPISRYEVTQLKKTLNEMLDKAGIYEEEVELRGPTQMHNLLELIKKEQNIYNIIFHELIRQTSVECLERGELLAELRDKYSNILNKVPKQIKGLHEEVLAQRALDRRLTEELLRFKTTISALTYELASVKEHDVEVTRQASQAQDELKSALSESHKNASLLAEYHELYELQRKRLETQVDSLAEEREIWSTVAYSLALKVMEEHSLSTAKRLHVSEKSWSKLAHHFTILLSDKDTVVLTKLQGHVDQWRDLVDEFNTNMCEREDEMRKEMREICSGLRLWAREFHKHHLSKQGHLEKPPDQAKVLKLYNDLKAWELTMSQESEKFGGDTVLTGQEALTSIRNQIYGWTDSASNIFSRHVREDGQPHPDLTDMNRMNEEVEMLLNQFNTRLTGENGVATGIIYINNCLEQWDNRFSSQLHGSNPLPDAEWLRFYQLLDDWAGSLEDTMQYIGTSQKAEQHDDEKPPRIVTVPEVMKMTHKWVSSTVNGTDSEDAKLVESVGSMHTEMVKWMVQMLLRLAPDHPNHSEEAKQAVLLGSATIGQLQNNAKSLFTRLSGFTRYVTQCCKTIVMEEMQQKMDQRLDNPDVEYKALGRLGCECNEWVEVAKMMLTDLTGETYSDAPVISVTDMLADSKPSTADLTSRVSFHDQEKLLSQQSIPEEPAQDTAEEDTETQDPPAPANQQAEQTTDDQPVEEPTNQQAESSEPANQQAEPSEPANETVDSSTTGQQQEEAQEVEQPVQIEEQPQVEEEVTEAAEDEVVPQPEQIEVIGYDSNTHKKVLEQSAESEPPPAATALTPGGSAGMVRESSATPPDTKKAYEALAALDSLQIQLLATEERAQGAESKVATLEDQLKQATERFRALERQYGVPEQQTEDKEVKVEAAPPAPETKLPEKVDKPKSKPIKEKSSVSSRSSSRSSHKPKKK